MPYCFLRTVDGLSALYNSIVQSAKSFVPSFKPNSAQVLLYLSACSLLFSLPISETPRVATASTPLPTLEGVVSDEFWAAQAVVTASNVIASNDRIPRLIADRSPLVKSEAEYGFFC